jgi:hypothetical protein
LVDTFQVRGATKNLSQKFQVLFFYLLDFQREPKKFRVLSFFYHIHSSSRASAALVFATTSSGELWLVHQHTGQRDLKRKGFYFLGDSAYALRSYLLTPFDNSLHGTAADDYNYFHSSSRIVVECTFGEIDMRWGIFWKPLSFSLHHSTQVIDACFRLHNFIVDFRDKNQKPTAFDELETRIFHDEYERFLAQRSSTDGFGVDLANDEQILDDNGEPMRNTRGRPLREETLSREAGVEIRNDVCENIKQLKLSRPKSNYYRLNNRTHEL